MSACFESFVVEVAPDEDELVDDLLVRRPLAQRRCEINIFMYTLEHKFLPSGTLDGEDPLRTVQVLGLLLEQGLHEILKFFTMIFQ